MAVPGDDYPIEILGPHGRASAQAAEMAIGVHIDAGVADQILPCRADAQNASVSRIPGFQAAQMLHRSINIHAPQEVGVLDIVNKVPGSLFKKEFSFYSGLIVAEIPLAQAAVVHAEAAGDSVRGAGRGEGRPKRCLLASWTRRILGQLSVKFPRMQSAQKPIRPEITPPETPQSRQVPICLPRYLMLSCA